MNQHVVNQPPTGKGRSMIPDGAMRVSPRTVSVLAGCALVLALGAGSSLPAEDRTPPAWVGSWASAQQVPEPRNALPAEYLQDATLRQVIRPSLGGERMRLRISNVFGTAPLMLGKVSIARSADPATSRVQQKTLMGVTFAGNAAITIPAGAYMLSDPIPLAVDPLTHLVVSVHYPSPPAQQTGHPGSRATSYVLDGEHVMRESLPGAKEVDHWYQVAGLDVEPRSPACALLVIGDSITDGFGVRPNTDQRWTDFLIDRIRRDEALKDSLSVLNVGLGGNRLLLDGLGPNGLARFARDALDRPGARHVIVLLGVNDLGALSREEHASQADFDALVEQMTAAYAQMVERARERGLQIVGGTIMPFAGSSFYPSNPMAEAARTAVNDWIRQAGNFDAVIDFDALARSPDDPSTLDREFDSGDGLHPSIEGYRAMAELVPLSLFKARSE